MQEQTKKRFWILSIIFFGPLAMIFETIFYSVSYYINRYFTSLFHMELNHYHHIIYSLISFSIIALYAFPLEKKHGYYSTINIKNDFIKSLAISFLFSYLAILSLYDNIKYYNNLIICSVFIFLLFLYKMNIKYKNKYFRIISFILALFYISFNLPSIAFIIPLSSIMLIFLCLVYILYNKYKNKYIIIITLLIYAILLNLSLITFITNIEFISLSAERGFIPHFFICTKCIKEENIFLLIIYNISINLISIFLFIFLSGWLLHGFTGVCAILIFIESIKNKILSFLLSSLFIIILNFLLFIKSDFYMADLANLADYTRPRSTYILRYTISSLSSFLFIFFTYHFLCHLNHRRKPHA